MAVERHADVGVLDADLAADGGEGVDGVGEVVADAAETVVELGRAIDGNGDDETGADGLAEGGDGFADAFGGDAVGGEVNQHEIGAGLGERLDDLDKIGAVGGLAAGEVDPLEEGIGAGERADLVERELVVETAGGVLDFPDVAIDAAGMAALGDDEDELGGRALDARGGGEGAAGETAPGVESAHGMDAGWTAGAEAEGISAMTRSRSKGRICFSPWPPKT